MFQKTISIGEGCPILVITENTPIQNFNQSNGKIITNGTVLITSEIENTV